MANVLGLDIGYSNLKLAFTTASSAGELRALLKGTDEERGRIDAELRVDAIPSGACRVEDLPGGFTVSDSQAIEVIVGEEKWMAGLDFTLTPSIHRDMSAQYKRSSEWNALLYAGLKWADVDTIDTLVLGLPCNEFYRPGSEEAEYLKHKALGEHEVVPGKKVTVKEVIVIAQPLGSFNGYMISEANDNQKEILENATTLVVDPGYGTLDWVVIRGGRHVIHQSAGSTQLSVRAICQEVCDSLHAKYSGVSFEPTVIESYVRNGKTKVFVNGDMRDFGPELKAATTKVGKEAFKALRSSLNKQALDAQVVILTGGGASLFQDMAKSELNADAVYTSEVSLVLNAFGYLREAL